MEESVPTPDDRFAALVEVRLARPEVSFGAPGKRDTYRETL